MEAPVDRIDSPPFVTLVDALNSANEMAEIELNRVNAEWSTEEPWSSYVPFLLSDYDKRVEQCVTPGGELEFWFFYNYRKPAAFRGHPLHFGVCVNRVSGEARLHGGR